MPTYTVITFGCQMNQHDSDRIGEVLRSAGYQEVTKPEQADVVLLNTCSVREKAEQKLRSEVGRLGILKHQRPGLVIGVAGCVAQQEGQRLLRRLPQIDLIVGPDNLPELPTLLAQAELGSPAQVRTEFDILAPQFLSAQPDPTRVRATAYVTVMKGCNERCSFCIVPYTRGPERYRPASEIIAEIQRWVRAGVSEVTLLGQTVNSYSDPLRSLSAPESPKRDWQHTKGERALQDESEFPALLRAIQENCPGLLRLRYTSPHPRHLTWSLIRAHEELPILARHLHLPVQSGSDRVLRRMIRRYSVAEYRERVEALRRAVPTITLSTDVIVGFPGETAEDFEKTLDLVGELKYSGLFGFTYSRRPYTPALKLGDEVSEAEKSLRLAQLFAVADAERRAHLFSLLDSVQQVLVEGCGRSGDLMGRSERNEIVHFPGPPNWVGRLLPVHIEQAFHNSLYGRVDPSSAAPNPKAEVLHALPEEPKRRSLPVLTGP